MKPIIPNDQHLLRGEIISLLEEVIERCKPAEIDTSAVKTTQQTVVGGSYRGEISVAGIIHSILLRHGEELKMGDYIVTSDGKRITKSDFVKEAIESGISEQKAVTGWDDFKIYMKISKKVIETSK